MGLYNFKVRFAPFILDGSKTHTIRAQRKHPDKPGNLLHLYSGLRTKNAKLLKRVTCSAVQAIAISINHIEIDGVLLSRDERIELAYRDGFRERPRSSAFDQMLSFWDGRLPFTGQIIHWKAGK